jgi:hypothetical protein
MPKKSTSVEKQKSILDYKPNIKTFEITVNDCPISVKSSLTLDEVNLFISTVVAGVRQDLDIVYLLKDLMIGAETIHHYTNIALPEEPADFVYDLISTTDIIKQIRLHPDFNEDQYNQILSETNKQIDFEMQKHLLDVRKECEKALEEFKAVTEVLVQSTELFKDISPEQMKKLVESMQNGFNEKKIVDIVLEKQKKAKPKSKKTDKRVLEMKPDANV